MGIGTVIASVFGNRISRRIGPGRRSSSASRSAAPAGCCSRSRPANAWGVAAFALMLTMFSTGAVFYLHQLPRASPGGDAGAAARAG
jgi:hypothetical protein